MASCDCHLSVVFFSVADYSSTDCEVSLDRDERVVAVGPPPLPLATHSGLTAIVGGSGSTTVCGTESNPWRIRVGPGQRINVTLIDFTASSSSGVASESTGTGNAVSRLFLVDHSIVRKLLTTTACRGSHKCLKPTH